MDLKSWSDKDAQAPISLIHLGKPYLSHEPEQFSVYKSTSAQHKLVTELSEYCKSNQRAHSYVVKAFLLMTKESIPLIFAYLYMHGLPFPRKPAERKKKQNHSMNTPRSLSSHERLHLHGCTATSERPW